MRTISKTRDHFNGTHKGSTINIEREVGGRFYIQVRNEYGCYSYDGWAPAYIKTMPQAKREARIGARLDADNEH